MERVVLKKKKEPKQERVVVMTGDYAARMVIIHAFLYYVMDSPIISDERYDKLSKFVSRNWDELSPDRQWACGSPRDIWSSGYHIKFSSHAVSAALNFLKYKTGEMYENYHEDVWRAKKNGTRYVTANAPKPKKVKNG